MYPRQPLETSMMWRESWPMLFPFRAEPFTGTDREHPGRLRPETTLITEPGRTAADEPSMLPEPEPQPA